MTLPLYALNMQCSNFLIQDVHTQLLIITSMFYFKTEILMIAWLDTMTYHAHAIQQMSMNTFKTS